jgi:predicted Holliday junction resolvase-like endonuclease
LTFVLSISLALVSLSCLAIYLKFKKTFNYLKDIENDNFLTEARFKDLEKNLQLKESQHRINMESLKESFKHERNSMEEKKREIQTKEKYFEVSIAKITEDLEEQRGLKTKVTSQKKSSEVRLGHIAETLAPFLDQFEFEPEECSFLGQPIDYISFGQDEVTFIEVKSGKSQLSTKQRKIRDQILDGKVAWKEVRIK